MPRPWIYSEKYHLHVKRFAVFILIIVMLWASARIPVVSEAVQKVQGITFAVTNTVANMTARIFVNEESVTHVLHTCTETLAEQVSRNALLVSAEDEVSQWRQLFAYERRNTEDNTLAARILARGALASSNIIIDRGRHDGIQEGNAVVIGEGYILGSVITVEEFQSTVRLIEDPKSSIAVTIMGQDKTLGLAVGNEGAVLSLQYVPQDATIAIGDTVVTSGLGGNIPEGLLVGIVSAVTTEESAPFVTATIAPIHDPRAWNVVLVLIK